MYVLHWFGYADGLWVRQLRPSITGARLESKKVLEVANLNRYQILDRTCYLSVYKLWNAFFALMVHPPLHPTDLPFY